MPTTPLPYISLITGPEAVTAKYNSLLMGLESELLMFVRPPFSWDTGEVNPTVIETMRRNVTARVLYLETHIMSLGAEVFRRQQAAYIQAGVQARVADDLPLKVTIFDRRVVLLVMQDPVLPEIGYPTTQLIEHPGYAEILAVSFERRWARGRPYVVENAEKASA